MGKLALRPTDEHCLVIAKHSAQGRIRGDDAIVLSRDDRHADGTVTKHLMEPGFAVGQRERPLLNHLIKPPVRRYQSAGTPAGQPGIRTGQQQHQEEHATHAAQEKPSRRRWRSPRAWPARRFPPGQGIDLLAYLRHRRSIWGGAVRSPAFPPSGEAPVVSSAVASALRWAATSGSNAFNRACWSALSFVTARSRASNSGMPSRLAFVARQTGRGKQQIGAG